MAPTPNHELEQLFAAYAEDRVPGFVDAKALAAFARRGDDAWSRGPLGEARELNPHIPVYLTAAKKLPEPRPAQIVLGEETEAVDLQRQTTGSQLMRALRSHRPLKRSDEALRPDAAAA